MRRAGQVLAVGVVVAMFALLAWRLADDQDGGAAAQVARGKPADAPDFSLPVFDGDGELSMRSLRGKAVVVNFWASWCGPCKDEAPALEAAWRSYRDQGLVVVGVNPKGEDFSGDVRRFIRRYEMTYPVVRAPGSLLGDFGLRGYPETFFVDRRGRIVAHASGPIDEERLDLEVRALLRT